MGVIPNPKMAFIFPTSCILALIFPILIKYKFHLKTQVYFSLISKDQNRVQTFQYSVETRL